MAFDLNAVVSRGRGLAPGLMVAGLVAMSAQFISEHYGAPAMLMALVFGMALNFLSEPGSAAAEGIGVAARDILRFGVFLLGARISFGLVAELGWQMFAVVTCSMAATLLAGLAAGRLFGQDAKFSVLTAGAVAICGASAALAISSVIGKTQRGEQDLFFTVLSVTLLSTLAMIAYPMALAMTGYDDITQGAFLGATIHDVAQVVGAGFLISDEAGQTATLVKLTRVTMLAPLVMGLALVARANGWSRQTQADTGTRPPLIPLFVIGFLVLAAANSMGWIPSMLGEAAQALSRVALLTAIAAVGLKSSLRSIFDMGPAVFSLVVLQTLCLAGFVLTGFWLIGA